MPAIKEHVGKFGYIPEHEHEKAEASWNDTFKKRGKYMNSILRRFQIRICNIILSR